VPPPLRIKVSTYAISKRLVALLLEETPPYESREKSDDIRGGCRLGSLAAPHFACGALKIAYDLWLLAACGHIKPDG
jgi:hypothetical protein